MKIVESYGPFHYEITGPREAEAAAEFEERYDRIFRNVHAPSEYIELDVVDLCRDIAAKYGVTIR